MKPAQWTAVLILASMVGGVTFIMVYLGGSRGGPEKPTAPMASLTFANKRYPEEGAKALTSEVKQYGHQDFWFQNDNMQEVRLGLNSKSCKCTEVEVAIVPEAWKKNLLSTAAGRLLQRSVGRLEDLPVWAATYDRERVFPELYDRERVFLEMPEKEVTKKTLTWDSSIMVPAGAIGWVRLKWRGEREEKRLLNADLWMNQRGGSVNAVLEVGVFITDPINLDKKVAVGTFDVRELEKGKEGSILCWSVTRPSFHVKAELVREGRKPEAELFEVDKPVPLSADELVRLGKTERLQMVRVLSGYRIPVRLRAKAKDGTPFELGHFRRFVELTSDDEGVEPMQVELSGVVQGDVTVGDAKEAGALVLGTFLSSRGARGSIRLHTDVKDLKLELDLSRKPDFLKVRFPEKAEVSSTGHRMWLLEAEVPPNVARGQFPNSDDPAFRDSAIYVKIYDKTKETPSRSIRIPVLGTANEG